jgi:peptidoglycan/xylan/chitin deacetylase (PgdA/CDA1 family)/glycosyltransferase involved in cell wall biosynthesis
MVADEQDPVLTAVVFGYRNEATILRAVQSLLTQESEEPFEVVVATSGGDRTGALVRAKFPQVRVAEWPSRLYPGGVRNLGVTIARGDIIAFLEADCIACPNWVSGRIALHRAGHGAVASAVDGSKSQGLAARAWLYISHPGRLVGHKSGPASPHQAYGLSFARDLLDHAGPFDETLRTDEDTLMAERLESLGVHPWFDPSVCIEHLGPVGLTSLIRDQYSRGRLDSWEETLRLPAGRLRRRWEPTGWACGPFVVLRGIQRLWIRLRWIGVELHRAHPGPFRELLLLSVPMALGQLAYQCGWIVDQFRVVRRSPVERRGELPIPAGLRRRVATTGEAVVALTFGDGPSDHTGPILDVLRRLDVPAAFFITGTEARERPDLVREIVAAGHVLGTSGWNRRHFTEMDEGELESALRESFAAIKEITGRTTRHVQPPDGAYDQRVVSMLQTLGLEIWLWTSHPHNLAPASCADDIVSQTTDDLTPGSVILLHDTDRCQTVEALPEIIRIVRERTFRFVPLEDPLAAAARDGVDASQDDGAALAV